MNIKNIRKYIKLNETIEKARMNNSIKRSLFKIDSKGMTRNKIAKFYFKLPHGFRSFPFMHVKSII